MHTSERLQDGEAATANVGLVLGHGKVGVVGICAALGVWIHRLRGVRRSDQAHAANAELASLRFGRSLLFLLEAVLTIGLLLEAVLNVCLLHEAMLDICAR